MNTETEQKMQYYAQQSALEWEKGRVCPRCYCHLDFEHHPACSIKELTDHQVLVLVEDEAGDIGKPWLYLPNSKAFPCPVCSQEMDHYRNIGRYQYGVCLKDRVYFLIGGNLFSSWKDEDEAAWEENKKYLSQFEFVGPHGGEFFVFC